MRKKTILEKILTPHGVLAPSDLTAAEKKYLYDALERFGMPTSTAYQRLFNKGFDEWELQGIDRIKHEFIAENNLPQMERVGEGFYSSLPFMSGLKVKLVNKLALLGMEHRNTVDKRFDADDWKPWERKGIRDIISELDMDLNG